EVFNSSFLPLARIAGRVVETDGSPVRRAVVNARGQSVFTDNNGGFVLANTPVITPDGVNDRVTGEIRIMRPDRHVDRPQHNLAINANAGVNIIQDFVLRRPTGNRQPVIIAPASLVMNEGETRDFNFVAADPDGQQLTVTISGAPFATVSSLGNNSYR